MKEKRVDNFMNKRMDLKKKKTAPVHRWPAAIVGILMLLVIGLGLYSLISQTSGTQASLQELKKTSFSVRSYSGDMIAEIELEQKEKTVSEGNVEDRRKDESNESESAERETEAETEPVPDEEASLVEAPEKDLSSMIANAKSNVFTIYTDIKQGSGFLFNDKGDILTNAHVVKDGSYITVKSSNGQEFNGIVIGISEIADIALVRVEDLAGKQPLPIEMGKVSIGTQVFAIGSPENMGNTSTEGEITATDQSFINGYQYENLYEMTANIKRGSSGGPLISAETGNVLGINSIILTDHPEIGYAIPLYTVIDQLHEWVEDPIIPNEEENVHPNVKDASLEEELLKGFISDFYELIPYSLNDEEITYYQFFLLPGSQGEMAAKAMVDSMKSENRNFEKAERTITSIFIDETKAIINVDASFTYHDPGVSNVETIGHSIVYTIEIDDFGDYRISGLTFE